MSNLLLRVCFACIAIPLAVFMSYLGKWYLWSLVLLVVELCWWEFCRMLKYRGFYSRGMVLGYLWLALFFLRSFMQVNTWLNTEGLLLILLVFLALSELWQKQISFSVSRMAVQFWGAVYLGICGYSIYLSGNLVEPGWKVFIPFLISIWACDTLSYFGGRLFGKNLLYPSVSPKKTVEGLISGIVGSVGGFCTVLLWMRSEIGLLHVVVLGVCIGLIGPLGDFLESMIKRWVGVKDSSNLLPGHGGVFDRIDSLLLAAPFVVFYFRYIL
jgi:phosphatidate cytidylyltransferase